MTLSFREEQTPHLWFSGKVKRILLTVRSPHQRVEVVDTEELGKVLLLDGIVQTTERDGFVYHEALVHIPLVTHPNPRKILVVGGGDGGCVKEILKHPAVQRLDLVEIDEAVVEAARAHFPGIAAALDDPRVKVHFMDGHRFVSRRPPGQRYDVILVDGSEPEGPAEVLFSPAFFEACRESLEVGGLMCAQSESPFFQADLLREVYFCFDRLFPVARVYLACVPSYPGGLWAFTCGSDRQDPADPSYPCLERTRELDTSYYTTELHRAAFVLPRFVQDSLRRD